MPRDSVGVVMGFRDIISIGINTTDTSVIGGSLRWRNACMLLRAFAGTHDKPRSTAFVLMEDGIGLTDVFEYSFVL